MISFIRLARSPDGLNQVRIADGRADAVVACDVVVVTDPRIVNVLAKNRTKALVNHSEIPSGQFVHDRNADIRMEERLRAIASGVGADNISQVEANALMENLMGHSVYANVFMLGHAWQQGLIPVGLDALMRAIEINGVNIEENRRAFGWGRLAACDVDVVKTAANLKPVELKEMAIDELINHRAELLVAFQDEGYSADYRTFVKKARQAEQQLGNSELSLTRAVATYLYKVMAYKDEYEVGRLYSDPEFHQKLSEVFTGDYKLKFNLAPPIINRGLDALGRPRKTQFGGWMLSAFGLLAKFKFLRGTAFDPFGYLTDRLEERKLIADYKAMIDSLLPELKSENIETAVECARLPDQVRGYGVVKMESIEQYYELQAGLVHRFRNPASVVMIQDAA